MSVIQNAGYMWHRKYIDWNKAPKNGKLIGYSEKGNKPINFVYQTAIYVLYDRNLNCIYIGQAGLGEGRGLYARLKDHVVEDELFCAWERFSWFGFYSTNDLESNSYGETIPETKIADIVKTVESLMIYSQPPSHNKSKGSIGIGDEEWYYQMDEYYEEKQKYEELQDFLNKQPGRKKLEVKKPSAKN